MAAERSLIGKFVLVGTERQVLAAGILEQYDSVLGTARLASPQQIVYWPPESRGAFGIASIGVTNAARVSPAAPSTEMRGVTGVLECSEAARKSIEAAPWSR